VKLDRWTVGAIDFLNAFKINVKEIS